MATRLLLRGPAGSLNRGTKTRPRSTHAEAFSFPATSILRQFPLNSTLYHHYLRGSRNPNDPPPFAPLMPSIYRTTLPILLSALLNHHTGEQIFHRRPDLTTLLAFYADPQPSYTSPFPGRIDTHLMESLIFKCSPRSDLYSPEFSNPYLGIDPDIWASSMLARDIFLDLLLSTQMFSPNTPQLTLEEAEAACNALFVVLGYTETDDLEPERSSNPEVDMLTVADWIDIFLMDSCMVPEGPNTGGIRIFGGARPMPNERFSGPEGCVLKRRVPLEGVEEEEGRWRIKREKKGARILEEECFEEPAFVWVNTSKALERMTLDSENSTLEETLEEMSLDSDDEEADL